MLDSRGPFPLISIIVPAFNTPDKYLRPLIASILAQSYSQWELCLVDGGSDDPARSAAIRASADWDSRIRLVKSTINLGIAGNSNLGIEAARGDFIALVDHDDTLHPYALGLIAAEIQADPGVDLVYTDEDKISDDGQTRTQPALKSAWSPDTLLCNNYIAHLLVVRATMLRQIGGFRSGYDGAQDYDLLLRLMDVAPNVAHVPQIAYHWRTADGSTSRDLAAKPEAGMAGERALRDWTVRNNVRADVSAFPDRATTYRLRYAVPGHPLVSVVGPAAIEVAAAGYERIESCGRLEDARGAVLLFVSTPLRGLSSGWLAELLGVALQPGVGSVSPCVLSSRMRIAEAGLELAEDGTLRRPFEGLMTGNPTWFGVTDWPRNRVVAGSACVMLTAAKLTSLGLPLQGLTPVDQLISIGLGCHDQGLRNVVWPFARVALEHGVKLADNATMSARLRQSLPAGDPFAHPMGLSAAIG